MNMGELITRDLMTVRQVADALQVNPETVKTYIRELFPELMSNGKTTFLNEAQVTAISISIKQNPYFARSYETGERQNLFSTENPNLQRSLQVKTDLEKELMIHQAMQWQAEKITKLQAENEIMKPKAIAYDQFLSADNACDMATAAHKLFGDRQGRNKLFKQLRAIGILKSDNTPFQPYMKYFKVVPVSKTIGDKIINFHTTYVKPEGIDYIAKKLHIIPEAIV